MSVKPSSALFLAAHLRIFQFRWADRSVRHVELSDDDVALLTHRVVAILPDDAHMVATDSDGTPSPCARCGIPRRVTVRFDRSDEAYPAA